MEPRKHPLVSVIIRTIGRPSLAASVESVVRQGHRPIELVIVNAGGDRLPPLPGTDSLDVRVVNDGRLNRPRAANAGLSAAAGDWIIFLDDDDTFHPEHLESLLAALSDSPEDLVAYSATECVDARGISLGVLSHEFDRMRLLAQNYIQIGAALFSSRLVAEGYRFDERFECFQDWDFWIQLAQRTRFAFTARATNRWAVHTGGSGCGIGPNSDLDRQNRFGEELLRKWASLSGQLRRKVRHHNALGERALQNGKPGQALRHFAAAQAVVRGSPPKARTATAIKRQLPPTRVEVPGPSP